MSNIFDEWNEQKERHPAIGEWLNHSQLLDRWECSASSYTDSNYSIIKGQIIDRLVEKQYIGKDKTLIDIGCGPGTFALPMSKYLKGITCMDQSEGMLSRVQSECEKNGVRNIVTLRSDWDCYEAKKEYDIAFASLCPPMNDPGSLQKMEMCCKERCIYISSANVGSGIQIEIWNELGKDYSYEGNHTRYPYEYLKEIGRNPEIEYFSEEYHRDVPLEKEIETQIGLIGRYRGMSNGLRNLITSVVTSHSEDGIVHQDGTFNMGLLTWKV